VLVLHQLFQAQLQPMVVVVAVVMLTMAALPVQVVLAEALMVMAHQRLVELQILVVAVVGLVMAIQAALAVAVLSSFVIQTHLEPQQAQQVHQQSLWLVGLGFINSLHLVQLLSEIRQT
jgi:hypothetical protein